MHTLPLMAKNHQRLGRISIADDDSLRRKQRGFRDHLEQDSVLHTVHVGDSLEVNRVELADPPDPMVYHFAAHGLPGRLELVIQGRTVWLSAEDGGRYIGGLRELAELPPEYTGMLTVCWSATPASGSQEPIAAGPPPHVDYPLEDVPPAQHVANVSRRQFTAPTGMKGFLRDELAMTSPQHGMEGRMVTFRPEPLDEELDVLAGAAGLDTAVGVSPGERRRVTRLTRGHWKASARWRDCGPTIRRWDASRRSGWTCGRSSHNGSPREPPTRPRMRGFWVPPGSGSSSNRTSDSAPWPRTRTCSSSSRRWPRAQPWSGRC